MIFKYIVEILSKSQLSVRGQNHKNNAENELKILKDYAQCQCHKNKGQVKGLIQIIKSSSKK